MSWISLYQKASMFKFSNLLISTFFLWPVAQSCSDRPSVFDETSGKVSTTAEDSNSSTDPLKSWNDGRTKNAIIEYVRKVTNEGSKDFIPPQARIATFDNDGTLWAEKPFVQELFAFYRVKQMVASDSTLREKQPFKAVIENDKSYFQKGGLKAIEQLILLTHTGMSEDQFEKDVDEFIKEMKYPGSNASIKQITYQPQVELLNYLRANGFKTFIVTGGTIEFVRAVAPMLYGIPREQVIGTTFKYRFVDSNYSIQREPGIAHLDDKEGKAVAIQIHIGQRPVFACGNEGGAGDIAMLQYSQGNKYPSFQMLINHDDSTREYFYQEKDSLSLRTAAKNNWQVVSIKDDWNKVFRD